MTGRRDSGGRSYYTETAQGTFVAVVSGHDKLVYDVDSDVFHRYDLLHDPGERVDVFDPTTPLDQMLIRELASFKPELFADELDDDGVCQLLADRLAEIDPHAPGAALPFLVRLVAAHPTRKLVERVVSLAEESDERGLRLLVLRYLWPRAPARLEALLGGWLREIADTDEELRAITALAAQGQPAFAARAVAKRLKRFADRGSVPSWEPYLRLIKNWQKRHAEFAPALASMLERSRRATSRRTRVDPRLIALVLDAAQGPWTGRPQDSEAQDSLVVQVRAMVRHDDPRVRAAALRALAALDDHASVDDVRRRLLDTDEDVRVRRAAVDAIALLAGSDATADLIAAGDDPRLTNSVVVKLRTSGSAYALPFLRRIATEHHNPYTRKDATKATEHIEAAQ